MRQTYWSLELSHLATNQWKGIPVNLTAAIDTGTTLIGENCETGPLGPGPTIIAAAPADECECEGCPTFIDAARPLLRLSRVFERRFGEDRECGR